MKKISCIIIIVIIFFILNGCKLTGDYPQDRSQIELIYLEEQTEKVLKEAEERLYYSYKYGANGPYEFDCSGFITYLYRQIDSNLKFELANGYYYHNATMDDLYNYNVVLTPVEKLRPGDIVFFSSSTDRITHGGLFIEKISNSSFRYIHASSSSGMVVIDTWSIKDEPTGYWFEGGGQLKKSQ